MDGLVQGKVAVITGAGSGVGEAACLVFARHGAKIVAADVKGDMAEATAALVREAGGEAISIEVDVGDEAAVTALVDKAVETFGRLDIIYNNAGITIPSIPGKGVRLITECTAEEIERVQRVNVGGVFNGCKAAIRQFEKQNEAGEGNGGVIVNTASVAGLMGYGGAAYGSTKGAVTNLTRALALELAGSNIRINSVCPAGMPTRYAGFDPKGPMGEKMRESMSRTHPLGRPIEPADTANAALFLCSELASNITGVNLPVDGGLSAGVSIVRRN